MHYSLPLRLLHGAIAVLASFQQISSLWMSDPGTQWLFPFHRILGVVAVLAVLLFWMHGYAMQNTGRLFPWGKTGRAQVLADGRSLLRGQLPPVTGQPGLAAFGHGIGILLLTGCAITGLVMFSMIPPWHDGPPASPMAFTRWTLTHKWFGQWLWWYWLGHIGFALLHHWRGERVFAAMFGRR